MSDDKVILRSRTQGAVNQNLRDITDRLMEVALVEANPLYWYGCDADGKTMQPNTMAGGAMDLRIKCKINAKTTIGLISDLTKLINLRESGRAAQRHRADPNTATAATELDKQVVAAVAEAERLIATSGNVVRMRKKAG